MRRIAWLLALLGSLLSFLLTSCYKKELDEFKNIDFKTKRDFAFPLFESTLSLKDSIPFSIPLLSLSDTLKTDLAIQNFLGDSYQEIDYVEFKIVLENNFPVTGSIQFYFADVNGKIIDSLFSFNNTLIDGGKNGSMNESVILIYMDRDKYKKIENSPKLYVRYDLETSNSNNFASNQLKIYTGIKFGTNF